MPLELSPLPPSDLHAYEDIVAAAFADSLQSVFYPGGFSPEAKAHAIAAETALWETMHADVAAKGAGDAVSLHYMRVVDTALDPDAEGSNGGVVGVSKWMIYPRFRSDEELDAEEAGGAAALKKQQLVRAQGLQKEEQEKPLPPGINAPSYRAFHAALNKVKRDLFAGEPYIMLHVLVTHPAHHRRGIGAMHLKWGEEVADRLGLPIYLEASAMGKPLYERWGYEEVRRIPFDARDWGAGEEMLHVGMVRPARNRKEVVNGSGNGNGVIANGVNGHGLNGNGLNGHGLNGNGVNGHEMNGDAAKNGVNGES